MSGPECGKPMFSGRRVRAPIGPCRQPAAACLYPEDHVLVVRSGCLHCGRLVPTDATRCVYCKHEPHTIDARCNCRAHVVERGGRAWKRPPVRGGPVMPMSVEGEQA